MSEPLNPDKTAYILRELREPAGMPADIPWYPETIGWKVLFIILLLFVLYKGVALYRHWKRNRYRREALSELALVDVSNPYLAAQKLSRILKVTARYALPDFHSSSLSSESLCQLLNLSCEKPVFDDSEFERWQQGILLPETRAGFSSEEVTKLYSCVSGWITQHKTEESA